jgi:hypothetical protein
VLATKTTPKFVLAISFLSFFLLFYFMLLLLLNAVECLCCYFLPPFDFISSFPSFSRLSSSSGHVFSMYTYKNLVCVFDSPLKNSGGVHIDREKEALDKKKSSSRRLVVVVDIFKKGTSHAVRRRKKEKNKHFSGIYIFYFVGFIVSIFPSSFCCCCRARCSSVPSHLDRNLINLFLFLLRSRW